MIPTTFLFKLCLATSDQKLPTLTRKYAFTGTAVAEDVFKGIRTRAERSFNLPPDSFDLAISVPNMKRGPTPLQSYDHFQSTLNFLLPVPNLFNLDHRGRTILQFVITSKSPQSANLPPRVNSLSSVNNLRSGIRKRAPRVLPSRRCTLHPSPHHNSVSSVCDSEKLVRQPYKRHSSTSFASAITPKTSTDNITVASAGDQLPSHSAPTPSELVNSSPDTEPWVERAGDSEAEIHSSSGHPGEQMPSFQGNCSIADSSVASIQEQRRKMVRAVNQGVARKLAALAKGFPRGTQSRWSSSPPRPSQSREKSPARFIGAQKPALETTTNQKQAVTRDLPVLEHPSYYPHLVDIRHDFSSFKVDKDSHFAGIYHTILSRAFHTNSRYTVCTQVRSGITSIEVHHIGDAAQIRPVLIVQCYPCGVLSQALGRKQADDAIRVRFTELASHVDIPRFHGLSICGSKARFYMLDEQSGLLFPKHEDAPAVDRVLPCDFLAHDWLFDLSTATGMSIVKTVIADARAMTEGSTIDETQSHLHSLNDFADQLQRVSSSGSNTNDSVLPSHDTAPHIPGAFNVESSVSETADAKLSRLASVGNLCNHSTWPDGLLCDLAFDPSNIRVPVLSIGNLDRVLHSFFAGTELTISPVAPDRSSIICFIVRDSIDRPVFLVQVSSSAALVTAWDRHEADLSMRHFFERSWASCTLPKLHGISVSNHSIRFYTLDTTSRMIYPAYESIGPVTHVLPRDYLANAWNYHLPSEACFRKLKGVIMDCLSISVPFSSIPGLGLPFESQVMGTDSSECNKPSVPCHGQSSLGVAGAEVVHYGIVCDGCAASVKGVRAKCTDCPDYDLCTRCYPSRTDFHPGGHEFSLHSTPVNMSSADKGDLRVLPAHVISQQVWGIVAIFCDRCSKKITDIRAKCSHPSCPDYDLCARCYGCRQDVHPKDHVFSFTALDVEVGNFIGFNNSTISEIGNLEFPAIKTEEHPSKDKPVHMADCDLCGKRIRGVRWKCLDCDDWDSCEGCLDGVQAHHPFHQLLPITNPAFIKPSVGALIRHAGVMCNGCDTEIVGTRYKCTHPFCRDYDLCSACESHPIPRHDSAHVMLKIRDSRTWKENSCLAHWSPNTTSPHLGAYNGSAIFEQSPTPIPPAPTPPRLIRTYHQPHPFVPRAGYAVGVPLSNSPSTSPCSSNSREDLPAERPKESHSLSTSGPKNSSASVTWKLPGNEVEAIGTRLSSSEAKSPGEVVDVGTQLTSDPELQNGKTLTAQGHVEVAGSSLTLDLSEAQPTAEQIVEVDSSLLHVNTTLPVIVQEPDISTNAMLLVPGNSTRSYHSSSDSSFNNTSEFTARYVSDINFPDGASVTAGSRFTKIWLVHNSGSIAWPTGTKVVFTGGYSYGSKEGESFKPSFPAPEALPNEVVEVAIEAIAPIEIGDYAQFWQLLDPFGSKFGERLWLRLKVVNHGDGLTTVSSLDSESESVTVAAAAAQDRLSASASFYIPRFTASGVLESSSACSGASISSPRDDGILLRTNDEESVGCHFEAKEHPGEGEHRSDNNTRSLSIGSEFDQEAGSEWSLNDHQFIYSSLDGHADTNNNLGGDDDFEIVTDSDSSADDCESVLR